MACYRPEGGRPRFLPLAGWALTDSGKGVGLVLTPLGLAQTDSLPDFAGYVQRSAAS